MTVRERMTFRDIAEKPVQFVKGVGPYFQDLLAKKNIRTLFDLMTFFPRDYEDRRNTVSIRDALKEPEKNGVVRATIGSIDSMTVNFRTVPKLIVTDGDMTAELPVFSGRLPKGVGEGSTVLIIGRFRFGRNAVWCSASEIDYDASSASLSFGRIVPIYELTAGLSQKKVRSLMESQLAAMRTLPYDLPRGIKQEHDLMSFGDALAEMHFPRDMKRMEEAKRTLVYEEFLAFQVRYLRENRPPVLAKQIRYTSAALSAERRAALPYRLTGAQEKALAEITDDMLSGRQMFRLLQGDVGSGKTVVAVLAALIAAEAGYQSALLAPTEILAEQHMKSVTAIAGDIPSVLLTGSLASDERAIALAHIASGEAKIIVGTHALIGDDVRFAALGLAVIDEQQRFGVEQRNVLLAKGTNVDYLLMTATPIPRSLAMTLFGELDLSVIDEVPAGRKGIRTKYVSKDGRAHSYRFLKSRIEKGEQGYVVFPLIDETADSDLLDLSNEYGEAMKGPLAGIAAAVVHGRMSGEEREREMRRFIRGEASVLFATSIIEVGIDNPNATTIIIEGAERFGLSQLHQMRGRVGRGEREGYCYLVHHGALTEAASKRLAVLADSNDGFRIAEEDLAIRGAGEFLGVKQAGLPEFRLGDIIRDAALMRTARADALRITAGELTLTEEFEERIKRIVGGAA